MMGIQPVSKISKKRLSKFENTLYTHVGLSFVAIVTYWCTCLLFEHTYNGTCTVKPV